MAHCPLLDRIGGATVCRCVKKKIFNYFVNSLLYLMNVYNVLVCHGVVGQTPRMSEISLPLEKLTDVMGK